MGAGIAAHLAAAGCTVYLLDLVAPPREGKPAPSRNAIAEAALQALTKSRPPALMSKSVLTRIVPGNLEDDLERAASQSDLVLEAVVERLDVKQRLFERVVQAARPDTIFATNTSGIPIHAIAHSLPPAARQRFVGLHFFNPPRWMHLLELIPTPETSSALVAELSQFCDRVLGKGVVLCRDTPNFIGNRIGIAEMLLTFQAALAGGYTIEEVDLLNGPLLGRPKTGSFRLGDLVGLDVVSHVVRNLEENLSSDPTSPQFDPLYASFQVPEVIQHLIQQGHLGDKTGAGFYKKSRDEAGKGQILALDLSTLNYRPTQAPAFPELAAVQKLPLTERVPAVLQLEGRAGDLLRSIYLPLFNYVSSLTGVICESPQEIDDAMRWGYGWQLGPFELLDAAGISWVVSELRKNNQEPASALQELLDEKGEGARFYSGSLLKPTVWVPRRGEMPKKRAPGIIELTPLRSTHTLKENPSAALIDLGDGVACLEFRSKANVLDDGVVQMLSEAPEFLLQKGFRGLVIGNQEEHFCRGANLAYIAERIAAKDFDAIEQAVRALQDAFMGLRHSPIPVVAAPRGQTLGGGTELCLHADEVQAFADLFLGLVEVGVGLLPAAGGLKEIARRAAHWAQQVPGTDPYHFIRRGFDAVATARVSSSALEAQENGFLSPQDGISFHPFRVISDAKKRALALAERGYVPPSRKERIPIIGQPGAANLLMGLQLFAWGGYASEHDKLIGSKIVHVLSGGQKNVGTTLTAQDFLDLEREAFVSLTGEPKTRERIEFMLKNKKPLRN